MKMSNLANDQFIERVEEILDAEGMLETVERNGWDVKDFIEDNMKPEDVVDAIEEAIEWESEDRALESGMEQLREQRNKDYDPEGGQNVS